MTKMILLLSLAMNCNTGFLTEHRAFDQVFNSFPNRIDDSVHGYVATGDCNDIGSYGLLIVGDNIKRVVVADCLNPSDKQKDPARYVGWVSDVDQFLYASMKVKKHLNQGSLCLFR